jgi:hypothetical protein
MNDDLFFEEVRAETDIKQDDIKGTFFRLFATDDGKKVLDHLRSVTLERSTLPDIQFAGNNMSHLMCVREGENNLFRYIKTMQSKGN